MNTKAEPDGRRASKAEPDHNFDVTEDSGYQFEEKVTSRNSNGWGGTQARLPKGHLARRDSDAVATDYMHPTKSGKGV